MSLHRVRLEYEQTGGEQFNEWVAVWLTNMSPWADRENTVPALVDSTLTDAPAHYRGDFTFAWSEDKSIIMDQLWGYLTAYCSWARLQYHVCDHDEENRGGCAWQETNEHGTIPEEI